MKHFDPTVMRNKYHNYIDKIGNQSENVIEIINYECIL